MHLIQIYFIMHEKDLVYGKIRTTVCQDETLQSEQWSSTELDTVKIKILFFRFLLGVLASAPAKW